MSNRDAIIVEMIPTEEEHAAFLAARRRRLWIAVFLLGTATATGGYLAVKQLQRLEAPIDVTFAEAREFAASGAHRAAVAGLRTVLQQDPDHVEARWLLAQTLVELGDGATALKEIDRARGLGIPADVAPLELRALLLEGRHEEVLERLGDMRGVDTSPELSLVRAEATLEAGRLDDADTMFADVTRRQPGNVRARRGLAVLAYLRGDYGAAARNAEVVLEINPRDVRTWVLKGSAELGRDALDTAREAFERARALAAGDLGAGVGLAQVHMRRRELVEARRILDALSTRHPRSAEVAFWSATLAQAQGNLEIAKAGYRTVLDLLPDHRHSLSALGTLYYADGEFALAVPLLQRSLALAPDDAALRYALGAAQLAARNPAGAVETLAPAIEQTDRNPRLLALLGRAYLASGRGDDGMALLEEAAARGSDDAPTQTEVAAGHLARGDLSRASGALEAAVAAAEGLDRAGVLLVLVWIREGKTDEALALAETLRSESPESPVAYTLLGTAHQAHGDEARARSAHERALALAPDFARPRLELAALDHRAGHLEAARTHYQNVLRRAPDHPRALVGLAAIEAARNRGSEALALLEQARAANPRDAAPRMALARLYLERREARLALERAEEALVLAPDNPQVMLTAGIARAANGADADARQVFARLVTRFPEAAAGHLELGMLHARSGDVRAAQTAFERVLTLLPGHRIALEALVRLALRDGDLARAAELAEQLRADDPQRPEGHWLAGLARTRQGRHEDALAAFRAAHAIAPHGRLVIAQASALAALGDRENARRTLRDWTAAHPADLRARHALAEHAALDGDREDAVSIYESILSAASTDVLALNNLSALLVEHDLGRALALSERAYRLHPDVGTVANTHGWGLFLAGRVDEAIPVLGHAVAAGPENPRYRYHLGAALADAGQVEEARRVLTSALAMAERFEGREEAKALLARLR